MTPSPDPNTAWQVVTVLAVLVVLAVNLVNLFRGTRATNRIEPQPFEVRKLDNFITRDFHHNCHKAMEERVTRVEAEVTAVRLQLNADRDLATNRNFAEVAKVYDRIEDHQKATQRTQQTFERALGKLEGAIDKLSGGKA